MIHSILLKSPRTELITNTTRKTWTDYVIFAKNKANEWKIDNLCYGEHFHLAGEDFNQQATLAGTPDKHGWYKTGYTENDIHYDQNGQQTN